MKRCFIVPYVAILRLQDNSAETVHAVGTYESETGDYVNQKKFKENILAFYKRDGVPVEAVTITNIIEVDEHDLFELVRE